jgi:hypothetical protein
MLSPSPSSFHSLRNVSKHQYHKDEMLLNKSARIAPAQRAGGRRVPGV